jgi:hypothetical protein
VPAMSMNQRLADLPSKDNALMMQYGSTSLQTAVCMYLNLSFTCLRRSRAFDDGIFGTRPRAEFLLLGYLSACVQAFPTAVAGGAKYPALCLR